jgi:hypothetical protein
MSNGYAESLSRLFHEAAVYGKRNIRSCILQARRQIVILCARVEGEGMDKTHAREKQANEPARVFDLSRERAKQSAKKRGVKITEEDINLHHMLSALGIIWVNSPLRGDP